ncbi:MAG: BatD family protein, partial [Verrucomicrobiota bacterium]
MKTIRYITFPILAALLASAAHAQKVYWVPSSGTLQESKANQLQLHFEGCEPSGNFDLPNISGLNVYNAGTQSQTSIINGRYMSKTIRNFRVTPVDVSNVSIPAFSVDTDRGPIDVAAASFNVV